MDPEDDAERRMINGSQARIIDAVPFQEWQRIIGSGLPAPEGATGASVSVPPNMQRQPSGLGANLEAPSDPSVLCDQGHRRRPSLFERASTHSSPNVLTQANATPGSDDLEPALSIGLNPRIFYDVLGASAEAEDASSLRGLQMADVRRTSSAISGLSKGDHEVIVTGEVDEELTVMPTPLGRARRQSLLDRAGSHNNMMIMQTSEDGDSSVKDGALRRAASRLSGGKASPREQDVYGADEEAGRHQREALSPDRGQYNTVLRDWLMHVLEKDDQQDAMVTKNYKKLS